jgi:hypothetical protein
LIISTPQWSGKIELSAPRFLWNGDLEPECNGMHMWLETE